MEAARLARLRRGSRTVAPTATGSRKAILTVVAAIAVLVLDSLTPMGLAVWLLQVALVWLTTLWGDRNQIIVVATVCAAFIILGFWLSPKAGPMTWIDQSNVMLGLGTVTWGFRSNVNAVPG
jgi:hypothetical protein